MTDEFEKTLHRALRPRANPGEDFAGRVMARLDSGEEPLSREPLSPEALSHLGRLERMRHRTLRSRWFPVALAACLIAGIGLIQLRQHALDAARASQARAQLLQALSIASAKINIVRSAVAREEHPDS